MKICADMCISESPVWRSKTVLDRDSCMGMYTNICIATYLLNNSWIVKQNEFERNYHIFYQFLLSADAETKAKYKLLSPADYSYLNTSGCIEAHAHMLTHHTCTHTHSRARTHAHIQARRFRQSTIERTGWSCHIYIGHHYAITIWAIAT